ncbi:MAG TPA: peptidylprolyl isomerase [Patescibacteria group bacterium]|nr:peptidylprolyl isomerase [Patescibacteria group bacterium]
MNRWALPIIVIFLLIFGAGVFYTQGQKQAEPNLPSETDGFTPVAFDENGNRIQPTQTQQQQQTQQQSPQQLVQGQQVTPPKNQNQQSLQNTQQQQTQQQPQQQQKTLEATYNAVIKTTKGNISLTLRADKAPNTVINFINKAESNFYTNLIFHRVEDWVIQGGDPLGNGTGGGNIPVEFNDLPFVTGALGAASRGDGQVQNDAQFFITTSDASWLNGAYTNFGIVTEGMDVAKSISVGDKILGITVEGIND